MSSSRGWAFILLFFYFIWNISLDFGGRSRVQIRTQNICFTYKKKVYESDYVKYYRLIYKVLLFNNFEKNIYIKLNILQTVMLLC